GLLSAVIAHLRGARVAVVGIDADLRARLPAARNLGFTVINSERDQLDEALVSAFDGRPVDVWVEASGAPAAFTTAVGRVRRGGKLLIVGMYAREVNWSPTLSVRAEHSLFFSYASADPDYRLALEIMAGGTVDLRGLVRFYPLERAAEAFQTAETGALVKAILVPHPTP
ncbi:MAG: zinc-binding dehydrogenase, partial [Desulfobacterales bacterium]|nr:zinc-binding dehydrogenase [Desulfobacterales bacterium]